MFKKKENIVTERYYTTE